MNEQTDTLGLWGITIIYVCAAVGVGIHQRYQCLWAGDFFQGSRVSRVIEEQGGFQHVEGKWSHSLPNFLNEEKGNIGEGAEGMELEDTSFPSVANQIRVR